MKENQNIVQPCKAAEIDVGVKFGFTKMPVETTVETPKGDHWEFLK